MAGTGALVRSQHATAPKLSSQRCWCKTGSYDGSETTYSHHREDSVNENERSSIVLSIVPGVCISSNSKLLSLRYLSAAMANKHLLTNQKL